MGSRVVDPEKIKIRIHNTKNTNTIYVSTFIFCFSRLVKLSKKLFCADKSSCFKIVANLLIQESYRKYLVFSLQVIVESPLHISDNIL